MEKDNIEQKIKECIDLGLCKQKQSMYREVLIGYGCHYGYEIYGCKDCNGDNKYCPSYIK